MSDSPINFMLYGHTPTFLQSQRLKNQMLKQTLTELIIKLNVKKESNLRCLKEIDNQQQTITRLKEQIQNEERLKSAKLVSQNSVSFSKQSMDKSISNQFLPDHGLRFISKSTEIPNRKVYLDKNNKSIQSQIEGQFLEKKLKIDIRQSKSHINTYGNLYGKKSYSLSKFKSK